MFALMGLLLVWRHSANIQKLLNGTESKLGQKAAAAAPTLHASKHHGHQHDHKRDHKAHDHSHGAKP
jgi:acyl phosphate:glycerol-3-phosphate acyltransferase